MQTSYAGLMCNPYAEYPIEQLFKVIYILQNTDDNDDIVEILKKKLEDAFANVEPTKKDMGKKYGGITYYPNGLCELMTCTSHYSYARNEWEYNTLKVVLSEWEMPEDPKDEKAKAKKTPEISIKAYNQLKNRCLLWYYQVREYMGQAYATVADNRIGLADLAAKEKKLTEKLNDEEKEHIHNALQNAKTNLSTRLYRFMPFTTDHTKKARKMGQWYDEYAKVCSILTNDEIKALVSVLKAYSGEHADLYKLNNDLYKFQCEVQKNRNNVICLEIDEHYHKDNEAIANLIIERIDALDNDNIKNVLKRLHVIPKE